MSELLDLDALDAELDDTLFTVRVGGRDIDVPNVMKLSPATLEAFTAAAEANETARALTILLPGDDGEWLAQHISMNGLMKFIERVMAPIQTVAGSVGEDAGSGI